MAGRYSSGLPNLDVYLQGHAGDPIRVDRRGRPPEFVDRPALTVGLAVQPYVLGKIARLAEFGGRGLLDRFLYSIPIGTVGFRKTTYPPVPQAIRAHYDASVRAIAATFDYGDATASLHLTGEALRVFTDWRGEIEPRRRPSSDLGHIQGWSSKLDGAVIRMAGLLHLAETFDSGWTAPIADTTVIAAITIGDYLIAHAQAAFSRMAADSGLEDARTILRWIIDNKLLRFSQRDCHRALESRFPKAALVGAALALLADFGWVRLVEHAEPRSSGRPSKEYEVNPLSFGAEPSSASTDRVESRPVSRIEPAIAPVGPEAR